MTVASETASLRNVDWQLKTMHVDGGERDVHGIDAALRVSEDDNVNGHACNSFDGPGVIGPDSIRVTEIFSTRIGCVDLRAETDDVTNRLLQGGARWTITGGALQLKGSGVELTYRARSAPWSNLEATPLVEGSFGPAAYRLAWAFNSSNNHIWVDWESRDRHGLGLSSTGIGRSTTEEITYLDPPGATVAARGFIFVPAPVGVDRVVWEGPNGTVELQQHDVPPAKTWRLFAGFIGGATQGGQAVGHSGGEEKLRSRVLPY